MACSCSFALMILKLLSFIATTSYALDSATAIYKQIFQDYEKSIRPVKNSSRATLIKFEIEYLTILGMNSAQESIEISIDYRMTWIDEHLTWHPSDFADPVESLVVLQSEIWQPDVTLYELLESTPFISDDKLKARVNFDGKITIYNPQIMTLLCKLKIDMFPFDSQNCSMGFTPWIYPQNEASIDANNHSVADMNLIQGNTEWSVVSFGAVDTFTADINGNFAVVNYYLIIKRNPAYYICVLILPTFIITTLCLIGIFSPSSSSGEREEKVNLGLTTLLTVAVILSLVAGEMPKATSLPLLGYFVLAELFICSLATLISILIVFFHQRVIQFQTPPPKWLQNWMSRWSNVQLNTAVNECTCGKNSAVGTFGLGKISKLESLLTKINNRIEKEESEAELVEQWKRIFGYVDLICLITLLLIHVLVSAYLLL